MPNKEQKETTEEVIGRILSESAFIFADPLDESDRPEIVPWEAQGVSLSFSGFRTGSLALWAEDAFLRSAAANMLGVDEDSEKAVKKGMDALKEILNIIVGNLLTTLYGSEPVFDLGIPEKLTRETLHDTYNEENVLWFEAEGNRVLFILNVTE